MESAEPPTAVAAIRRLDARDRFCLVTYDDHIDVVVPSTVPSGKAVPDAVRAIMAIEARGSTAGRAPYVSRSRPATS